MKPPLVSQSRGTTQDTQTAGTGDFTFPSVLPDTYTVRVSVAPQCRPRSGGFLDMVPTNNVAVSVTRLMGRHTVKEGYQLTVYNQVGNPLAR